ncbi:hypothetical protein [Streptomyces sp. NPDC055506]
MSPAGSLQLEQQGLVQVSRDLSGRDSQVLLTDEGTLAARQLRALQADSVARKGYTLIDPSKRPAEGTPSFGAFLYLRDVALLTRRLLWIYTERKRLGAP